MTYHKANKFLVQSRLDLLHLYSWETAFVGNTLFTRISRTDICLVFLLPHFLCSSMFPLPPSSLISHMESPMVWGTLYTNSLVIYFLGLTFKLFFYTGLCDTELWILQTTFSFASQSHLVSANGRKGLPRCLRSKESACQCRRCRFDPWVKKVPRSKR